MTDLKKTNFTVKELESMYQEFMKLPNASVNGSLSETQFFDLIKNFAFGRLLEDKPELKKTLFRAFRY